MQDDLDNRPDSPSPELRAALRRYWRTNVTIMIVLLAVWALVSLGLSILLAPALNRVQLGGFPLGFWFAQQGSIIVFVLLILVYAVLLNRLDRRHHEEFEHLTHPPRDGAAQQERP